MTENVTGFPLLVRLDSTNFDFAQARPDGFDVRFATADGTPMTFDLEQWDAVGKRGAIWVKVDTILPDDSAQFIRMFWGNMPVSVTIANSAIVFSPAQGFAGVWHLRETAAGVMGDATGNGNAGTVTGGVSPVPGIAGGAQRFNGVDGLINCGTGSSLDLSQSLTLSGWVKLDTAAGNRYQRIVSKKDVWNAAAGYELECNPGVTGDTMGEVAVVGKDSTLRRGFFAWDTAWHHCAATVTDSTARVYIDGNDLTAADNYWSFHGIAPSTVALQIGAVGRADFLKGVLDEVRVESVPRSASWIRLCYENQRSDGRIVAVRR
jgi:hypothetical protein